MIPNEILSKKFEKLRRQAEERILRWPDMAAYEFADMPKIIHELRIHLAELEIQNEELKQALQQAVAWQNKEVNRNEFGLLNDKIAQFPKDFHQVMAHRRETSIRSNENEKWK